MEPEPSIEAAPETSHHQSKADHASGRTTRGHKLAAAAPTEQQHTPQPHRAVLGCLETIAKDVGRLRRDTAYTGSLEHTIDRIAYAIEDAIWMHKPPAAVLYRGYLADGYAEDAAVTRALHDVDSYQQQLLHTLRDDIREEARCAELELRSAA